MCSACRHRIQSVHPRKHAARAAASLADAPLHVRQTKMQQLRAWRQAAAEHGRQQSELEGRDEAAADGQASDKSKSQITNRAATI